MRRSGDHSDPTAMFNLDSLMDIVTNVLGALFFVVVFVVLGSTRFKGRIVTPMVTPSETERVYFECRGNTVIYPQTDSLLAASTELWNEMSQQGTDWDDMVRRLRAANIHNRFYHYDALERYRDLGGLYYQAYLAEILVPDLTCTGEPIDVIAKSTSDFRRRLATLDPTKHHVYFYVRNDSYEAFLAARRIATQRGFRAGWRPLEATDSLFFSSGGIVDPGGQ